MNILVVDDEPAVRRMEIRVLENAGHHWLAATGGLIGKRRPTHLRSSVRAARKGIPKPCSGIAQMVAVVARRHASRMTCVRILLVDDAPDFIASAADFLSRDPRVAIVEIDRFTTGADISDGSL